MELDRFRQAAGAWLRSNAADAPPDYGAILPPDLRAEGTAWQRRLHDAGFAGLHWPEEYGGRGLTPGHTAVWLEEAGPTSGATSAPRWSRSAAASTRSRPRARPGVASTATT